MEKSLILLTSCAFNLRAALPLPAITHVVLVNLTDGTCLLISSMGIVEPVAVPSCQLEPNYRRKTSLSSVGENTSKDKKRRGCSNVNEDLKHCFFIFLFFAVARTRSS